MEERIAEGTSAEVVPKKRGRKPGSVMTQERKEVLAEGRTQSKAVRAYLDALDIHRPKRGRKVSAEHLREKLESVITKMNTATPGTRLTLIQERINLEESLRKLEDETDLSALEEGFVAAAKPYAQRKGICRAAFREAGVPVGVLDRAGV